MERQGASELAAKRDPLTGSVIGAAIEVHKTLGPGLLESAYEACLCAELKAQGIGFESQVEIPVVYRDVEIRCGYRLDLLVEETLIVEIKAVDALAPIHDAQLLTYLRLTNLKTGLLLNFNSPVLRQGVKRLSL